MSLDFFEVNEFVSGSSNRSNGQAPISKHNTRYFSEKLPEYFSITQLNKILIRLNGINP